MAWANVANIRGPQGATGGQGPQGTVGSTGPRGATWFTGAGVPGTIPTQQIGDLYLDTNSGDIYKLA